MRRSTTILLSLVIVVESLFYCLGDPENKYWEVFYYVAQSALIIGLLLILRGWINSILLSIVAGINVIKIGYNGILLFSEPLAYRINSSCYVGSVIVTSLMVLLLINIIDRHGTNTER